MAFKHHFPAAGSVFPIPGGLKIGTQIIVKGKVLDGTDTWAINLQSGSDAGSDIPFHFNPRPINGNVVRNTYQNGWGVEERDKPNFPFNHGDVFNVHIHVAADFYTVVVNHQFYINYNHRLSYHDVQFLRITEGCEYYEATIEHPFTVPYVRELDNQLGVGMAVRVAGSIPDVASRFHINFSCEDKNNNVAFHFNPRQDQNDTVCNTKTNGNWGVEERGYPEFPFTRGSFFDIYFLIENGKFIVSANGKHFTDYNFRMPLDSIKYLEIHGDASIENVSIYDHLYDSSVVPLAKPLAADDLVTVRGYFKPGAERFKINLMNGLNASDDVALHVNPRRGENQVVLNTLVNGGWQHEERHTLPSQYNDLVPFIVQIANRGDHFDIYMDGVKLASYNARLPVGDIKGVQVAQDAYFHDVQVHHKLENPFTGKVPGTAEFGEWMSVWVLPHADSAKFAIDVQTAASGGDIAFHYNPRFTEGQTVRNSLINNSWGVEEREESSFPFNRDQIHEINMMLTPNDYRVYVDEAFHIKYNHRVPPSAISHVTFRQFADFYSPELY